MTLLHSAATSWGACADALSLSCRYSDGSSLPVQCRASCSTWRKSRPGRRPASAWWATTASPYFPPMDDCTASSCLYCSHDCLACHISSFRIRRAPIRTGPHWSSMQPQCHLAITYLERPQGVVCMQTKLAAEECHPARRQEAACWHCGRGEKAGHQRQQLPASHATLHDRSRKPRNRCYEREDPAQQAVVLPALL